MKDLVSQEVKFDLFEGIKDNEFQAFVYSFVRLSPTLRQQVYDVTYAFSLVQDLNDNDEVVIPNRQGQKTDHSAPKNIIIDKSVEPISIRLNKKRFFCDCGNDKFIPNSDNSEAICTACNSSYNL